MRHTEHPLPTAHMPLEIREDISFGNGRELVIVSFQKDKNSPAILEGRLLDGATFRDIMFPKEILVLSGALSERALAHVVGVALKQRPTLVPLMETWFHRHAPLPVQILGEIPLGKSKRLVVISYRKHKTASKVLEARLIGRETLLELRFAKDAQLLSGYSSRETLQSVRSLAENRGLTKLALNIDMWCEADQMGLMGPNKEPEAVVKAFEANVMAAIEGGPVPEEVDSLPLEMFGPAPPVSMHELSAMMAALDADRAAHPKRMAA